MLLPAVLAVPLRVPGHQRGRGPAPQGVREVVEQPGQVVGEVLVVQAVRGGDAGARPHGLHPQVDDARTPFLEKGGEPGQDVVVGRGHLGEREHRGRRRER